MLNDTGKRYFCVTIVSFYIIRYVKMLNLAELTPCAGISIALFPVFANIQNCIKESVKIKCIFRAVNQPYRIKSDYSQRTSCKRKLSNRFYALCNSDSFPVNVSLDDYQNIIIVTPLWWSQMAAIMQTYLFNNSAQMAGKTVALIVSSHSSGISGVVADAQRLLPNVTWAGDALWINNANHSNRSSLIQNWLPTQNFATSGTTAVNSVRTNGEKPSKAYTLQGTLASASTKGIIVQDGKIIIR